MEETKELLDIYEKDLIAKEKHLNESLSTYAFYAQKMADEVKNIKELRTKISRLNLKMGVKNQFNTIRPLSQNV